MISNWTLRIISIQSIIFIFNGQVSAQSQISTAVLNDTVTLVGTVEVFDPSAHLWDICDLSNQSGKLICLIDGELWYGAVDAVSLPRYEFTSLIFKVNDCEILLDVSGMFNPTSTGKISSEQFKIVNDAGTYLLYGYFSDGAGTYIAHWKIVHQKSMRLVISTDEEYFWWQR